MKERASVFILTSLMCCSFTENRFNSRFFLVSSRAKLGRGGKRGERGKEKEGRGEDEREKNGKGKNFKEQQRKGGNKGKKSHQSDLSGGLCKTIYPLI